MDNLKTGAFKIALQAIHRSFADRLLAPFTEGQGLIFTLHHVRPWRERAFAPNRILEVTPEFLETTIRQVQAAGLDVVSLEEAVERIAGRHERRFACFTFDDGYRDNAEHAAPIFRGLGLPLTIYVPTDFPDRDGELWWLALEDVIARSEYVRVPELGAIPAAMPADKYKAFSTVYWWLRNQSEERQRRAVRDLCAEHGVDQRALCGKLVMNWDELRAIASNPLVTIGAHTRSHRAIAKLAADDALSEMQDSADRIEKELGRRPAHFSFPYGDAGSAGSRDFELARDAGFATAVTTRKGMIFPEHRNHLHALPRVSLNGEYQAAAYTDAYLTGAPFALMNRFRRVDAA